MNFYEFLQFSLDFFIYIAVSRTKQSYSRFDLQLYDKAAEDFAYLTVNNKRKLVISYICIAVY